MQSKKLMAALGAAMTMALAAPTPAAAQDAMLGEIRPFGFNFCPRGWAPLDGQLLAISQYTALFSLLGTYYGGDGRTTFALPDMRGRVMVHEGTGPGLPPARLGQTSGTVETAPRSVPVAPQRGNREGDTAASTDPVNNMQPYLVVNWCIALQGIYPSRN
ncbi:phage tail protein [Sphingomicrobium sediminis]|uniref:Tail fiber protein n=1 Tax=Sphingomicrobium sediminis TaxID=2950949 RepID=A0A9X2J5P3_9SPHN|nr:tail fiber protein [Sphingomicrobium sediminis]MCM8558447.1 tail fiber protein [Sphingomicrobium sediminis]